MKTIILTMVLALSTLSFGQSIEITVPDGTEALVLTAQGVQADMCNSYSLFMNPGINPDNNDLAVGVIQTEMACVEPAFRYINVTGTAHVKPGESLKLILGDSAANWKIEFL